MSEATIPLLTVEESGSPPLPKGRGHRKIKYHSGAVSLLFAALGGAISALIIQSLLSSSSPGDKHNNSPNSPANPAHSYPSCPSTDAIPLSAPRKNIWRNLDVQEASELRQWLMDPKQGLNLSSAVGAVPSDNYIQLVEVAHPPKQLALNYLNDERQSVDRYAHAIIAHGSQEKVVDYLVGPLPISRHTTLRARTENYHNPIPLNSHAFLNWTMMGEYFARAIEPLDPVLKDLFNGTIKDDDLYFAAIAPTSYDGAWRRTWGEVRRSIPGQWLLPLDMYFYLDMTGTDPSLYKVLRIVHNGKMWESIDSFLSSWRRGELVKSLPEPYDWATRAIRGEKRDLDDRVGPRTVQFDGARYRLDRDEQYITWMGWSFYIGFERDMGVHLWNINFRDERIIYELSPQEAMAQYSGSDPHQGQSVWLDRTFGMGQQVRRVIVGYDCPFHAIYLDAVVHEAGSSVRRGAICVFERESGRPLSRHFGEEENEMGAVKGYELVVRSISTVGNYDYLFDYTFQLDGTIEIRVSASGYLQGGTWHEGDDKYGHKLSEKNMGSLHDHVMNFKVDFDIAGMENSLMAVTLEMEDNLEPWFDDEWGSVNRQQRIARKIVDQETLLEWPRNAEGAYVIVNQEAKNAWGNPRGYTVHPGPLCHLTNLENKRTEHNVNWAKHHLAVSKRKDEEPTSSSMWNMNLPGRPPVNFYNFFDNESIVQEDLVLWVNLGTHHIPRAEDSPNTLTNIATSYVSLVPWNYFDYDVSLDSRNSILINEKDVWEIREAAVSPVQGQCVPPRPPFVLYAGTEGFDEKGDLVERDLMKMRSDMGTPMNAKYKLGGRKRKDDQEL